MTASVATFLAVPFLLFLGLMALPPGWPAKPGIGIAAVLVLLLTPRALPGGTPGFGSMNLLRLDGPVALAAAGQSLLSRPGTRRVPLVVTGCCLIAAPVLIPVLLGAS